MSEFQSLLRENLGRGVHLPVGGFDGIGSRFGALLRRSEAVSFFWGGFHFLLREHS